ncbi:MAG TPA: hypothetical protein V6D12_16555 [Candidatus Obscuribacterales bacterium]
MVGWRTVTYRLNNLNWVLPTMDNKNSDRDPVASAVTAALGAGIVTSFAVSQGQNPLVALGITSFAVVVALVCDRAGLV